MTTNEGDEQVKNTLAQYPERYHKLRKAIARKKESIGRSHEADGHTRASKRKRSPAQVWDETKQTLLAKRKPCLEENDQKKKQSAGPKRILARRKDLGDVWRATWSPRSPRSEEQPRRTTQQISSVGNKELLERRTTLSKAKEGAQPGQLLEQPFQGVP